MINMLIADDNIYFSKCLLNYILQHNQNIRLINIATNGNEVLSVIKKQNIDLILLDLKMPNCDGLEVLAKIDELKLNKNLKIIVITGDLVSLSQIQHYSFVIDIISKENHIIDIYNKIESNIKYFEDIYTDNIMNELLYLGFNIKHNGTQYLYEAIKYLHYNKNLNIQNLEKQVYSVISCKYKKSISLIKNNIIKAINYMYIENEYSKLKVYFSLPDGNEEKPTAKRIIYYILKKIS